jgi:hypothetical protein
MTTENSTPYDQENITEERSFDELAKGLSNGTLSRGKALKLLGGAFFGAALMPLFPQQAQALTRRQRRRCRRQGGTVCSSGTRASEVCCPSGTTCLAGPTCCPSTQVCGSACCQSAQSCVNGTCCPSTQVCGSACCQSGETCVATCPPSGDCFIGDDGDNLVRTCCPEAQVCNSPFSISDRICCNPGDICLNGRCYSEPPPPVECVNQVGETVTCEPGYACCEGVGCYYVGVQMCCSGGYISNPGEGCFPPA